MSSNAASQGTAAVARLRAALQTLTRDPAAARAEASRIVGEFPQVPAAYRVLALAERELGDSRAADRHELESIAVALASERLQQAHAAMAEGRIDDAEPLVRAHLKGDPEDPAGALMLAEIAKQCGAKREAENLMRRAIMLAPAYAEARFALAQAQRDAGSYEQALGTLEELLARDPVHQAGLSLQAGILVQLRRFEEAEASFRKLLEHHPHDSRAHANFAFMLKTIGRVDEAVATYRKALAADPGNAQSWWGLANLKTVKFSLEDVAAMRTALAQDGLQDEERFNLQFALGKACDDNRLYEEAFAAFEDGARLRREKSPHDPERVLANVRKVEEVFTANFFADREGWGCQAAEPIFIVSLPRSGSTLVEQILASHPLVEGTEELFDIERIAIDLAPRDAGKTVEGKNYADAIAEMDKASARRLGEHYIDATRRFRKTGRPFFADKMPSNWAFTGLIHLLLPNARIIDVRRHPLGCGFANFSQHFNWGINFSYDLGHIGNFYSAYVRQMAHFDREMPGLVHRVFYEDLVEHTEREVRRLLEYLDLPFDEACLRFFENRRAVHTPSSEQVRSPINREGMTRWRNYEPWLTSLKEALGPVLEHYPEVPSFPGK